MYNLNRAVLVPEGDDGMWCAVLCGFLCFEGEERDNPMCSFCHIADSCFRIHAVPRFEACGVLFYGSAAARIPEGYIKDSEGKSLGGHPVPPPAYEQELPGLGRLVDLCVLLLLLPVHHMAFRFLPRRFCQSDGLSGTEYIADIHLPSDIHDDVKIHAPVVLL